MHYARDEHLSDLIVPWPPDFQQCVVDESKWRPQGANTTEIRSPYGAPVFWIDDPDPSMQMLWPSGSSVCCHWSDSIQDKCWWWRWPYQLFPVTFCILHSNNWAHDLTVSFTTAFVFWQGVVPKDDCKLSADPPNHQNAPLRRGFSLLGLRLEKW